ncbi:MAG: HYR domain-containing protein [Verrucomicrobia bacterium]|nr:HYR domain-containing protein [Verrucomicrobiota bacterium]
MNSRTVYLKQTRADSARSKATALLVAGLALFTSQSSGQDPQVGLSVGGTIFLDQNNDGHLDPSEIGIDGVFVALFYDNGDGIYGPGDSAWAGSTYTSGGGFYRIDGLSPGNYVVAITRGNFYHLDDRRLNGLRTSPDPDSIPDPNDGAMGDDDGLDTVPPSGDVGTRVIMLDYGTQPVNEDGDPNTNLTVDLGFYAGPTLTVGGQVFLDSNGDGQIDPSEVGIDGVGVGMFEDNGNGIYDAGDGAWAGFTYTSGGGHYRLDGMPPGNFVLQVSRGNFYHLDDRRLNGLRTSPDAHPAPDPNAGAMRDDDGLDTVPPSGDVGTRVIMLNYATQPVNEDSDPNTNLTVDFGFYVGPTLTVGGQVFLDSNGDGQLGPGEMGIDGVGVAMFEDNGNGIYDAGDGAWAGFTYTSGGGQYRMDGMPPGNFVLVVSRYNFFPLQPFGGGFLNGLRSSNGLDPAPDPNDGVLGDDNGFEVPPPSGDVGTRVVYLHYHSLPLTEDGDPDTNLAVDFGFSHGPTLTLGGTVFLDWDNNGYQDPGELGIDGVDVGMIGDGGGWAGLTTTTEGGRYEFTGLPAATYFVFVLGWGNFEAGEPLDGLRTSTDNDPAPDPNNDVDGDDNGSEHGLGVGAGIVVLVYDAEPTIDDGDSYTNYTIDFGFYDPLQLDTTPPTLVCPDNLTVPCSANLLVPVDFQATATDDTDPSPTISYSHQPGSGFPAGTTTVTVTARDVSGNESSCSFTVTRPPLEFTGFLPPIGGADATSGSYGSPVRSFKLKSTIPVKFTASCGGSPVLTGIHTLQAIKWSNATTPDPAIDASPTDAATTGNQFRLAGSEWHFNLDTKATGMSAGIWQLIATLSDGSQHSVLIQIK